MRVLMLAALLALSCKTAPQPAEDVVEQYPDELVVEELAPGAGDPAYGGATVTVHYTGWLTTGKVFDSSRERGPFTFRLGAKQVIRGWDQGVSGMKVGGKRKLTIPPRLGYRDKTAGSIPPNSWLIFEVELLGIAE